MALIAPKVVDVQAKVPVSVPHERTPVALAFTSQDAALRLETIRSVVDAVPETVIAVVDAYGRIDALVDVDTNLPARKMLPSIESLEPGEVVPMPRFPSSLKCIFSSLLVAHAKYSPESEPEISALNVALPAATSMRKSVPTDPLSFIEKLGAVCETRRLSAVSVVPSKARSASDESVFASVQKATRFNEPLPAPWTNELVFVFTTQLPAISRKHPAESCMPLANVEDAVEEVMLSAVD